MKRKTGFTLVELLVVMAIIAILASIAVPSIVGYLAQAQMTRAMADINSIEAGLTEILADANRSQLSQIFNPAGVQNAARAKGAAGWPPSTPEEFRIAQEIYSTALYGLIRSGRQVIGDTEANFGLNTSGNPINYEQIFLPEILARLGLGYVPDLGTDPWGNLYNIYPGPWRARVPATATTPPGRLPVPFRVFLPPETELPGAGLKPDRLTINASNAFTYSFSDAEGNVYGDAPGLEVVSLPAETNRLAFIWSNGANLASSQAIYDFTVLTQASPDLNSVYDIQGQDVEFVGGGDDINNWDPANSFGRFY